MVWRETVVGDNIVIIAIFDRSGNCKPSTRCGDLGPGLGASYVVVVGIGIDDVVESWGANE